MQEWNSQQNEATEQASSAEEEQARAKAAAKKAKKQKQKARRTEQAFNNPSPTPASSNTPAIQPSLDTPAESSAVPPAVPHDLETGHHAASSSVQQLQQDFQQLEASSQGSGEDAEFLAELFCCPLSKVCYQLPM